MRALVGHQADALKVLGMVEFVGIRYCCLCR